MCGERCRFSNPYSHVHTQVFALYAPPAEPSPHDLVAVLRQRMCGMQCCHLSSIGMLIKHGLCSGGRVHGSAHYVPGGRAADGTRRNVAGMTLLTFAWR